MCGENKQRYYGNDDSAYGDCLIKGGSGLETFFKYNERQDVKRKIKALLMVGRPTKLVGPLGGNYSE